MISVNTVKVKDYLYSAKQLKNLKSECSLPLCKNVLCISQVMFSLFLNFLLKVLKQQLSFINILYFQISILTAVESIEDLNSVRILNK